MASNQQGTGESAGIAAVVFDAVGTVMYPNPTVADAYRAAIQKHCSVNVAADLVQKTIHDSLRERSTGNDLTTNEESEREFWAGLIRRLCPRSAGFQACFDDLFEHFAKPESWSCYPDLSGIIETLDRAGVQVAIASNFDLRLNAVCDGLDEFRSVEHRIISSVVGWRKPAPQFFAAVVDELGVPPNQILMVGDDRLNDIQGAANAGMQTAWICRNQDEAATDESHTIISSLQELSNLVPVDSRKSSEKAG